MELSREEQIGKEIRDKQPDHPKIKGMTDKQIGSRALEINPKLGMPNKEPDVRFNSFSDLGNTIRSMSPDHPNIKDKSNAVIGFLAVDKKPELMKHVWDAQMPQYGESRQVEFAPKIEGKKKPEARSSALDELNRVSSAKYDKPLLMPEFNMPEIKLKDTAPEIPDQKIASAERPGESFSDIGREMREGLRPLEQKAEQINAVLNKAFSGVRLAVSKKRELEDYVEENAPGLLKALPNLFRGGLNKNFARGFEDGLLRNTEYAHRPTGTFGNIDYVAGNIAQTGVELFLLGKAKLGLMGTFYMSNLITTATSEKDLSEKFKQATFGNLPEQYLKLIKSYDEGELGLDELKNIALSTEVGDITSALAWSATAKALDVVGRFAVKKARDVVTKATVKGKPSTLEIKLTPEEFRDVLKNPDIPKQTKQMLLKMFPGGTSKGGYRDYTNYRDWFAKVKEISGLKEKMTYLQQGDDIVAMVLDTPSRRVRMSGGLYKPSYYDYGAYAKKYPAYERLGFKQAVGETGKKAFRLPSGEIAETIRLPMSTLTDKTSKAYKSALSQTVEQIKVDQESSNPISIVREFLKKKSVESVKTKDRVTKRTRDVTKPIYLDEIQRADFANLRDKYPFMFTYTKTAGTSTPTDVMRNVQENFGIDFDDNENNFLQWLEDANKPMNQKELADKADEMLQMESEGLKAITEKELESFQKNTDKLKEYMKKTDIEEVKFFNELPTDIKDDVVIEFLEENNIDLSINEFDNTVKEVLSQKAEERLPKDRIIGLVQEKEKEFVDKIVKNVNESTQYHGSSAIIDDLKITDKNITNPGNAGTGLHFTPYKFIARSYGAKLNERNVKIENPLIIERPLKGSLKVFTDKIDDISLKLGVKAESKWSGTKQMSREFSDEFRDKALEAGFDSSVTITPKGEVIELVVYNPEKQVITQAQELGQAELKQQADPLRAEALKYDKADVSQAVALSGAEVLKTIKTSIPADIKKYIKEQTFELKEVDIDTVLNNDPDAKEFFENSKPSKAIKSTEPIIIGKWFGKDNAVMDGWHRIANAKHRGETTIKAYVADTSLKLEPKTDDVMKAEAKEIKQKTARQELEDKVDSMFKGAETIAPDTKLFDDTPEGKTKGLFDKVFDSELSDFSQIEEMAYSLSNQEGYIGIGEAGGLEQKKFDLSIAKKIAKGFNKLFSITNYFKSVGLPKTGQSLKLAVDRVHSGLEKYHGQVEKISREIKKLELTDTELAEAYFIAESKKYADQLDPKLVEKVMPVVKFIQDIVKDYAVKLKAEGVIADDFYENLQVRMTAEIDGLEQSLKLVAKNHDELREYFKKISKETARETDIKDKARREMIRKTHKDITRMAKEIGYDIPDKNKSIKRIRESLIQEIDYRKKTLKLIKEWDLKYVPIPYKAWIEPMLQNSYKKGISALSTFWEKRKTISAQNLARHFLEENLITLKELDPRRILMEYVDKAENRLAMANIINTAKAEGGLVKHKDAPQGYVSLDVWKVKGLAGYSGHPSFVDYIENNYINKKIRDGYVNIQSILGYIKVAQFTNPFGLGWYNLWQSMNLGVIKDLGKISTYKSFGEAFKDVFTKSGDYIEAVQNGALSNIYKIKFDESRRMIEGIIKANGNQFVKMFKDAGEILADDNFFDKIGGAFKVPALLKKIGLDIPMLYIHQTAWGLNNVTRVWIYKLLKERGYTPEQAGRLVGKATGDYSDVPASVRHAMNKVLFTPTFWVSMMKFQGESIYKLSKMIKDYKGTDKADKLHAMAFFWLVGGIVATDFVMKRMGYDVEVPGYRYKKEVDTQRGRRDLVMTIPNPNNVMMRYFYRLPNFIHANNAWWKITSLLPNSPNPVWSRMANMLTNRDFTGEQIYNYEDSLEEIVMKQALYGLKIIRIIEKLDPSTNSLNEAREVLGAKQQLLEWFGIYVRTRSDERTRTYYQLINQQKGARKALARLQREAPNLTEMEIEEKRKKIMDKYVSNVKHIESKRITPKEEITRLFKIFGKQEKERQLGVLYNKYKHDDKALQLIERAEERLLRQNRISGRTVR